MPMQRFRITHPYGEFTVDTSTEDSALVLLNEPIKRDAPVDLEHGDIIVTADLLVQLLDSWCDGAAKAGVLADFLDEDAYFPTFTIATVTKDVKLVMNQVWSDSIFDNANDPDVEFGEVEGYHLDQLPFEVTVTDESGQLYDEYKAGE